MITLKGKLIDLTLNITSLTFPRGLLFVKGSKDTCGWFFREISFKVITINDNNPLVILLRRNLCGITGNFLSNRQDASQLNSAQWKWRHMQNTFKNWVRDEGRSWRKQIPKGRSKNSEHLRCLPYVFSFQPHYFVIQNIHLRNFRLCHHIDTD